MVAPRQPRHPDTREVICLPRFGSLDLDKHWSIRLLTVRPQPARLCARWFGISMLLLRPPGVYPPQHDTWLLADVFRAEVRKPGQHVLDICTGTGALAVVAALQGAASVTVVDVSRRALTAAWLNARARGLRVCARRGDLVAPVSDQRFDVILSNPPYVCAESDHLPTHGQARAWDGGVDGRAVLDRVCAEAPKVLAPGGTLLIVHSALCGVDETVQQLAGEGLDVSVAARRRCEFGPVMRARAQMLEARGLIQAGERTEELVVVRAVKPVV